MTINPISIKRNDVGYLFNYSLVNDDGSIPNLTGATVKFNMGTPTAISVSNPATIVNATSGEVSYQFTSQDTLNSGSFIGEFQVTFSNGNVLTYPRSGYISVNIQANVDTALSNVTVDAIAAREGDFTNKLNQILANNSSFSEVIDARGTFTTLGSRLNNVDSEISTNSSQLADIAIDVKKPPGGLACCTGDGITDDSAALQAIINYLKTTYGYGKVYFPYTHSGYKINSSIINLRGIKLLGGGSGKNGFLATSPKDGIFSKAYFVLDDLVNTVNDPNGNCAFFIENNTVIENVTFAYKTVDVTITSGTPPQFTPWTLAGHFQGAILRNLGVYGATNFLSMDMLDRNTIEGIQGFVTNTLIRARVGSDYYKIDNIEINTAITTAMVNDSNGYPAASDYFVEYLGNNVTLFRMGSSEGGHITNIFSIFTNKVLDLVPYGTIEGPWTYDSSAFSADFDNVMADFTTNGFIFNRSFSQMGGFATKISNSIIIPKTKAGTGVTKGIVIGSSVDRGTLVMNNVDIFTNISGELDSFINAAPSGEVQISGTNMVYECPTWSATSRTDFSTLFKTNSYVDLQTDMLAQKSNNAGQYKKIYYSTRNMEIWGTGIKFGNALIQNDSNNTLSIQQTDGNDNIAQTLLNLDYVNNHFTLYPNLNASLKLGNTATSSGYLNLTANTAQAGASKLLGNVGGLFLVQNGATGEVSLFLRGHNGLTAITQEGTNIITSGTPTGNQLLVTLAGDGTITFKSAVNMYTYYSSIALANMF